MPGLSNIQTFEKIGSCDFRPALDRFCRVIRKADLWNDGVRESLLNFEFENEGDGLRYTSLSALGHPGSGFAGTGIRALIIGYTSAVGDSFKHDWISCEFLLETEDLCRFDGKFHNYSYDLVRTLSREMQNEFGQTGVYFTNERQDGSDFDGIRCNDRSKLWQFDYALIPLSLSSLYKSKPASHSLVQHDTCLEAWNLERWKEAKPLAVAS